MSRDPLFDADHWCSRPAEARKLADLEHDPTRPMILRIAKDYHKLAERADIREQAVRKSGHVGR
jgi:hypothetical protein